MTTLLLAVFSKRNESTVVIDTCGVTDSFLWRYEIERLGTVQVAHIHRKTCPLGWPREVGAQDSSPQSRIFTTSSPGRLTLALEVGRPREMRPGDEVGIFTSVTVGSRPCSY